MAHQHVYRIQHPDGTVYWARLVPPITFDPLGPSPVNELWDRLIRDGLATRHDRLYGEARPDAKPAATVIELLPSGSSCV